MEELKPMLDDECIDKIKEILCSFNRPIEILEWGAGKSTVYFPQFLHEKNIPFNWTSIEEKKEWFNFVNNYPENNVIVHLCTDKRDYLNIPNWQKYDLIFIDGNWRNSCIMLTKDYLKEDGIVLLHDAHWQADRLKRIDYLEGEFITKKTWKGKLKK